MNNLTLGTAWDTCCRAERKTRKKPEISSPWGIQVNKCGCGIVQVTTIGLE